AVGGGDRDLVVDPETEPEAVEAGAEVGAGPGHPDPHRGAGRHDLGHRTFSRRGRRTGHHARPRAASTAAGSTDTVATSGITDRAVSGSLSPLPVTVHTTVWPGVIVPSAWAASRPATEDAEAGSTNTPSRAPSNR